MIIVYTDNMPYSLKKNLLWLLTAAGLVALDLLTKWLAQNRLNSQIDFPFGFFKISLSHNTGIAFSLPIPNEIMIFIIPVLMGLIFWLIIKSCDTKNAITKLGMALIAAGAFGNLINRIWTGNVIDFLDFSFWPSFNLADSYITIAAFLFILFYGKITIKKYGSGK